MSETLFNRQGECRCGQVKFTVSAAPLMTMACHCTGCQRMSASAYSLSAMVLSAAFTVIQGEPVRAGLHGDEIHHYACDHCKSWLFTRFAGMADFVNLRYTMLDDTSGLLPFIETYTDEKLDWVDTPAKHSFATGPSMEEFGALMGEYKFRA